MKYYLFTKFRFFICSIYLHIFSVYYRNLNKSIFYRFFTIFEGDAKISSQSLFVETPRGLYFRYLSDTALSVRMELNLYDIAVVILKSHLKPNMARGLRGTAGSGKGVRTLLEHFNLSLCYDFNAPENHTNFYLTTKPASDVIGRITVSKKYWGFDSEKSYDSIENIVNYEKKKISVDLDVGRLELSSVSIPQPTAIQPLELGSKVPFGEAPYSIVLSYEDMLYTMTLIREFIGMEGKGKLSGREKKRKS